MTRVFVDGVHVLGETVTLHESDARKLVLVLRAREGDAAEIIDSSGRRFEGRLALAPSGVRATLVGLRSAPAAPALELSLAQAIPKGQKMDFVLEKATELGVTAVWPLVTERTLGDAARAGKLERWRRLARTAAQQCGRSDVPAVGEPRSWDALLAAFASFDRVLVPWESADLLPLREELPPLLRDVRRVLVVIGPEGGFSHAEIDRALAAGANAISLGARVLRTETAGLVACAAIRYASGDL